MKHLQFGLLIGAASILVAGTASAAIIASDTASASNGA
jgi:hypothetical protein